MQKPPAYVLRLATGCEERAHSYRTQNTVTSSSAERSLLKAETEYMEGTRAAGRRPFMPDSALNRRSEALSGWKHNKCPLLPLNYPENRILVKAIAALLSKIGIYLLSMLLDDLYDSRDGG